MPDDKITVLKDIAEACKSYGEVSNMAEKLIQVLEQDNPHTHREVFEEKAEELESEICLMDPPQAEQYLAHIEKWLGP